MEEYCKVLIIDDELIIRQGIKHMADWEKEGFRIVGEASDGQEGLRLVKKHRPHIVLADIVMPVMDGLEFSVRLQEEYPEIQLIILSSYDKFEYVKTALLNGASNYILKPMLNADSLLEALRKAAAKISNASFCHEGKTSCEMQLTRYMGGYENQLGVDLFTECLSHPAYRIMAVNLKTLSEERTETIRQKAEVFFRECTDVAMVSAVLDETVLCMVLNYPAGNGLQYQKSISEFANRMKTCYEKAFLVYSWEYTDFEDTREVFREGVCKALSMRFYFPGKSLVVLEEKPVRRESERFEYETYSRYLESMEPERAAAMLMDYIEGLARVFEDEYKIKNLAKNLLFNYFVAFERLSQGAGEDVRDRCFLEIDQAEDVETFLSVVRKFVPDQDFDREKNYDLSYIQIEKMKEYIGIHYKEDLKLMDLAKQFGFSYCYISTYFKENMSEGFSGYLNKIRISKAKNMLIHTAKSIAEVGSEAGYTDQSYFCRVFKKATGVTPGKYRRNNGGKNSEMAQNCEYIDV